MTMKPLTAWTAGLTLGAAILAADAPSYAQEDSLRTVQAAPMVVLRVGPDRGRSFVPPDEVLPGPRRAANFKVTYRGFSTAARRAFQRAVNRWSAILNSNVTITVLARFRDLGDPNILGSAGPSSFRRNFRGAPRANTWYHEAVANKRFGSQIDRGADIVANFNSTFTNWHFGKGPAPAGEFDFTTVVMHELGHGLGFSGLGRVGGGLGSIEAAPPGGAASPGAYDRFIENRSGKRLTSFPDPSVKLFNQLQSNDLYFDSRRVRNANNGKRAKIFAPRTFLSGSSYSHLNENTYPNGNRNSLMTPFLSPGETIRSPGPIGKAILKDVGW
jgi:hypothetical protein